MKRVVIVGSGGQDGRILFEQRARDCAVLGLDVGAVTGHALAEVTPRQPVDLQDRRQVDALCERVAPDEVYYLAAHHHSAEEHPDQAAELRKCFDVHVVGLVHVLEGIRAHAPKCRLFYAGSSQMFGQPASAPQDEATPFAPRNPYAITKVAAAHACALYRERYGLHASVGVLYNHESPFRGPRFVTTRIVRGALEARRNRSHKLVLGSLVAVVDWGYAPDYVDAMVRIVAEDVPDDYVVASGVPHTVKDFVEVAFAHVGLDWRMHVEEDPRLIGPPAGVQIPLVGNAGKLRARTGWRPAVGFEELVKILIEKAA
jgi:GDPmannose 4,6-dehydratase